MYFIITLIMADVGSLMLNSLRGLAQAPYSEKLEERISKYSEEHEPIKDEDGYWMENPKSKNPYKLTPQQKEFNRILDRYNIQHRNGFPDSKKTYDEATARYNLRLPYKNKDGRWMKASIRSAFELSGRQLEENRLLDIVELERKTFEKDNFGFYRLKEGATPLDMPQHMKESNLKNLIHYREQHQHEPYKDENGYWVRSSFPDASELTTEQLKYNQDRIKYLLDREQYKASNELSVWLVYDNIMQRKDPKFTSDHLEREEPLFKFLDDLFLKEKAKNPSLLPSNVLYSQSKDNPPFDLANSTTTIVWSDILKTWMYAPLDKLDLEDKSLYYPDPFVNALQFGYRTDTRIKDLIRNPSKYINPQPNPIPPPLQPALDNKDSNTLTKTITKDKDKKKKYNSDFWMDGPYVSRRNKKRKIDFSLFNRANLQDKI